MARTFAMTFFGSSGVMHRARSNRGAHESLLQHPQHLPRADLQIRLRLFSLHPTGLGGNSCASVPVCVVLGTLASAGLSGNYERLYGHWGSLPRREALDVIHWPGFLFSLELRSNVDLAHLCSYVHNGFVPRRRALDAGRCNCHLVSLCCDHSAQSDLV